MLRSISYIIPTLNEEDALPATLRSIRDQPGDKEILIIDGGSNDATLEIAKLHACAVFQGEPGRGAQMNLGASKASGDILLFLHADTIIPQGAAEEIDHLLGRPGVLAGTFRLSFDVSSFWLRLYSLCSSINAPLFTYGDQGLFIQRTEFQSVGNFQAYPLLEDVEFQTRLRKRGRVAKSKLAARTSARRFQRNGPLKQQLLNLAIVCAYRAGASPHRLARYYSNLR